MMIWKIYTSLFKREGKNHKVAFKKKSEKFKQGATSILTWSSSSDIFLPLEVPYLFGSFNEYRSNERYKFIIEIPRKKCAKKAIMNVILIVMMKTNKITFTI